jgi:predicted trehalose synthase
VDENEIIEEVVEEILIPPTPWHNSDTVAVSFNFAAQIAQAAAQHFSNLAMLSLGQSAQEWDDNDRAEFENGISGLIAGLPEVGEENG